MFNKLQEFLGIKKKSKYKAKNFTKSRVNKEGHREVYDSSLDQWLLWSVILDDTDYIVDFNSFTEVPYSEDDGVVSNYDTELKSFVESYVTDTSTNYSPSSSSSSWSDSSGSSSYDSGSSSSGGWD